MQTAQRFPPLQTYDISEDGKTYTFHLRDAKWSNGEAVTAADFVFGWQRAVDPATASEYSYMLSDIGQVVNAAGIIAGEKPVTDLGVTAVDDKTLEVQLNVPVSYFEPDVLPHLLSGQRGVLQHLQGHLRHQPRHGAVQRCVQADRLPACRNRLR